MFSYDQMMMAFKQQTTLEKKVAYCKVLGPNANGHYFIIERNGALSVAVDISVPEFKGLLTVRRGRVGRFTEQVTARAIDAKFGGDLPALVAIVVKALKRKPGAW